MASSPAVVDQCANYSAALDLTATANQLSRHGRSIDPDDLATVTPNITSPSSSPPAQIQS